ncbi:MAG: TonB family protein [Ignavibacteriaceae bacterium]|nr:TonB family protein [Ignavibacteriaceae bacterium]
MDKQKEIELVKLEVLGCINENEIKSLRVMKENDENFPWKELAQYQNLASLLPSILVAEIPSPNAKDNMIKKLTRSIFGAEDDNELEIVEIKEEKSVDESSEKLAAKDNMDWSSLSISDSLPMDVSEFQEVKTKKSRDLNEFITSTQITKDLEKKELLEPSRNQYKIKSEIISSPHNNLRRYVLISLILFVLSVSVAAYFLIGNTSEITEFKNEIFEPVDNTHYILDLLRTNSLMHSANVEVVRNIPIEDIQDKETNVASKIEQNILPTAPPTLPEPINAPLVELTKNSPFEDSKVKEEISLPPPKENLEIKEEPTYFVAVEEMPEPIGGLQEIQSKIEYPVIAKRVGIEGKVFVRAFVDETGVVTSAEVVKGIGGGCDEAALDAILKTKFNPGKQRGKPIKVQVTIPILFKL